MKDAESVREQIIEEFIRVEEICSMVSFYFLKLYNIGTFKEKTKYFMISKQVVFFVIQRSLSRLETIERNLEKLLSIDKTNQQFLDKIITYKEEIKNLEKVYHSNKMEEVINKLDSLGNCIRELRAEFKNATV